MPPSSACAESVPQEGTQPTFGIRDDIHLVPLHSSSNHRISDDSYSPISMMSRCIGRQEPLARRSNVRMSDVGEDRGAVGWMMEDDAGTELVGGAFETETDQGLR